MTESKKIPVKELDELNESLAFDLLSLSDEEVTSELKEEVSDMALFIAEAKQVYQSAVAATGRRRLFAAKEVLKNNDAPKVQCYSAINFSKAKKLLSKLAANDANLKERITLAARNLEDLTEEDVRSIVGDLMTLGAISDEDLL
jgi:phosphoenolpyruvate carboxylase